MPHQLFLGVLFLFLTTCGEYFIAKGQFLHTDSFFCYIYIYIYREREREREGERERESLFYNVY